jgi:hypothetical protein
LRFTEIVWKRYGEGCYDDKHNKNKISLLQGRKEAQTVTDYKALKIFIFKIALAVDE